MSEQIPAGWYPDPKDTTSDPRPERWWDGKGWTATTRPAPGSPADEPTAVIEGRVLDDGPTVRYPELPLVTDAPGEAPADAPGPWVGTPGAERSRPRPSRPVVVAATIAALAGLAVGSGVTYLAMDGKSTSSTAAAPKHVRPKQGLGGGSGGGLGNGPGGGLGNGFGGQGGGGLPGGGGKGGGGKGGGSSTGLAVDQVNGISLPVPSGWDGGTTAKGFAGLTVGQYTCPDGSQDCSLGGVTTSQLQGGDPKQAAQADIAAAAKESYGDIKSHDELKNEAVTVDGRSGYLVRWKVGAPQGNDGYVETVVFPTADGKALAAVHLGFDIDPKAPSLDQMDTIVKSIADYQGGQSGGPTTRT